MDGIIVIYKIIVSSLQVGGFQVEIWHIEKGESVEYFWHHSTGGFINASLFGEK